MSNLVQIEPLDMNEVYALRTIADRVKEALNGESMKLADEGFRGHLGASVIGAECSRYLYYHFFWFKREKHTPRMERIFEKGRKFEAEMRETMKAAGAQFLDQVDETGKQLQFSDVGGHFGGSVDGIFIWPAIGINEPTLLECKSSKTGSPFNDLYKKGVMVAKGQHYKQQCTYGSAFNITHALYVTYNKNDSDLYVELVELPAAVGQEMRQKAASIIGAQHPPERISKRDTHFVCKMCPHHGVCHMDEDIVPNCRNCKHSVPVDGAQWMCNKFQDVIPKDFITQGCPQHELKPR